MASDTNGHWAHGCRWWWWWRKGRGEVWWEGCAPSEENSWKFLYKNNVFLCKIFTCFKMHPVNREAADPLPLFL